MISLRHHAISLVAVFLALALGLVLGAGFFADRGRDSSGSDASVRSERDALNDRVNAGDAFISAIGPRVVRGVLAGRSVVILTAPDAAQTDVAAVKAILNQSGAQFAGQLGLTDDLVADASAEKLTSIVDQSIPGGTTLRPELTDSGGRLGDLLGALLLRKGTESGPAAPDVAAALQALRQAGFVDFVDNAVRPGQLAVVVTGGALASDAGARGSLVARLAAAVGGRSSGAVLLGRTGSARGGSPVAVVRSDPGLATTVASVDDIDTEQGRVAAVLALADAAAGKPGAYGSGPGADAVVPGA
ncbi:copper transporter [Williamsia sp. CHRR-6]|uniref:copper transporter n=1 Tax=Williamsia sp. CHRR-6 TaxID=2835871 RepID=UPI001BD9A508|nr:copper transporter [Williamsia sp. CHRR-6]MBT0568683.1 copper transporter [Williamsia sp. CHRR-6]